MKWTGSFCPFLARPTFDLLPANAALCKERQSGRIVSEKWKMRKMKRPLALNGWKWEHRRRADELQSSNGSHSDGGDSSQTGRMNFSFSSGYSMPSRCFLNATLVFMRTILTACNSVALPAILCSSVFLFCTYSLLCSHSLVHFFLVGSLRFVCSLLSLFMVQLCRV